MGILGDRNKSMTRQEVNDNFAWERECQPIANAIYDRKGYKYERVKGKKNKLYDVKLYKWGNMITVEEKFLRELLDFMYVEIMQDTKTNSVGWIEYCKANYLLYMMAKKYTIICEMEKLKKFIRCYGIYYPLVTSTKGWGISTNRKIPFTVLYENEIGREIITM